MPRAENDNHPEVYAARYVIRAENLQLLIEARLSAGYIGALTSRAFLKLHGQSTLRKALGWRASGTSRP